LGQQSWNGFEHDVLYMNEGGKGFVNVAHLFGVAFEFDGRNVISDDFDGDGKMDLLVVEKQLVEQSRYLHLLKNNWPTKHNWVGVRLAESRPGFSPLGADVRIVMAGGGEQVGRLVAGDSLQSQHAAFKHFGLGKQDKIESIEVTWPNGETTRIADPAINTWHHARPTSATAAAAAR
ncbi:MAG: ASPIC/UnbV domain-containing protein, partial [Pseudomonadota bacterium]|nr:ASPIC/UnbV domain-containing protein [Pseudomonadota bacterium]